MSSRLENKIFDMLTKKLQEQAQQTQSTAKSTKEYTEVTKRQEDQIRKTAEALKPLTISLANQAGVMRTGMNINSQLLITEKSSFDMMNKRAIALKKEITDRQELLAHQKHQIQTQADLDRQTGKKIAQKEIAKEIKLSEKKIDQLLKEHDAIRDQIDLDRERADQIQSTNEARRHEEKENAKAAQARNANKQEIIAETKERERQLSVLKQVIISRHKNTAATEEEKAQQRVSNHIIKKHYETIAKNEATRRKELEQLKQKILANQKLVPLLHRILNISNKVAKQTLLGVRNQRLLNNSLATFRSKLLIASFGIGLVQRSVRGLIGEYAEYQAAQQRVNSALTSTGFVSGQSVKGLSQLASEIQSATGVSDTLTLSSSALLTTFTAIGGETFPMAQKAIVDMTAAMNAGAVTQEGLKSSTVQVGKALNSPIKGLTALSRVGVLFTKKQKDQIEVLVNSGKVTEAQSIILKELNKEFGNTASADSYEKSMRLLDSAMGDLQKEIGVNLIPKVEALAKWMTKVVEAMEVKDILEFITAIGIAGVAVKGLQARLVLTAAAAKAGTTRIVALGAAMRTLSIGSGGVLALVTLGGLLIERLIDWSGLFDNVANSVENATNKFSDFTEGMTLDELKNSVQLSGEMWDWYNEKLIDINDTSHKSDISQQQVLENIDKETSFLKQKLIPLKKVQLKFIGRNTVADKERAEELKKLIATEEFNIATMEKKVSLLEKLAAKQESEKVQEVTDKYKNQLAILKELDPTNKALVKVSQELFDGKQDLIVALDDEKHKYHELAVAIADVTEKQKEQTQGNQALREAMQITGEGISFLSDLAQSAMDRDLEAMRQSNAYKLAEERGQTSKMEKLEKNAMRKSLLTRQALFLAEQALAAGSVVLNYEIAKAKGFLLVSSSPLTRSSYHADEDFSKMKKLREEQYQCRQLQ